MADRRALMITYFFPPIGGVGVQRTLTDATYLPLSGWTPVIVAARSAVYRVMDEEAAGRLPADLEVHRSFCYEPAHIRQLISRVARIVAGSPSAPQDRAPASTNDVRARSGGRLNAMWARAVRLLFFPDDQVLWIPFAIRSAVGVHRRRPARVVYSSSAPISAHVIAGLVKRMTGLPWVADFRDPWIDNAFAAPLPPFQRMLQKRIERWIVQTADRVVFATPGLLARYRDRYPAHADRFVVITNGYDATDRKSVV